MLAADRRDHQDQVDTDGFIDTNYIDGLELHLGIDVTIDIMADGLIALTDRLENLRQLSLRRSVKRHDLAQMAHDIVGTGGQLGLHALTFAARKMERAAITESDRKLQDSTAEALSVGEHSLDALGIYLKTMKQSDFGVSGD